MTTSITNYARGVARGGGLGVEAPREGTVNRDELGHRVKRDKRQGKVFFFSLSFETLLL